MRDDKPAHTRHAALSPWPSQPRYACRTRGFPRIRSSLRSPRACLELTGTNVFPVRAAHTASRRGGAAAGARSRGACVCACVCRTPLPAVDLKLSGVGGMRGELKRCCGCGVPTPIGGFSRAPLLYAFCDSRRVPAAAHVRATPSRSCCRSPSLHAASLLFFLQLLSTHARQRGRRQSHPSTPPELSQTHSHTQRRRRRCFISYPHISTAPPH